MDTQQRSASPVSPAASAYRGRDGADYSRRPLLTCDVGARGEVGLMRIAGYEGRGLIRAERSGSVPEAVMMVARGWGKPLAGMVGGVRLRNPGFRDLQVAFAPEQADVWIDYHSGSRNLNLVLPPGLLGDLVEGHPRASFAPILFEPDPELTALALRFELELVAPSLAGDMLADAILRRIAARLAGLDWRDLAGGDGRLSIAPWRVKRVIDYVAAHLAQPLSLAELAQVAGMSPFHFARAFRSATGKSPYAHVLEQRIALAQRLLMEPDQPIGAIAAACGFPRHASFTSAFTRQLGISPRDYRQRFAL